MRDARDWGTAKALFEVVRIRYAAFRERFGRDPLPDDPLLFDPTADKPIAATTIDQALQVLSAALLGNVDADLVLKHLGLPRMR